MRFNSLGDDGVLLGAAALVRSDERSESLSARTGAPPDRCGAIHELPTDAPTSHQAIT